MSRGATLSIMGLYNNDPTVLDMMVFPEGFTDAQKTTTKENILIECAEFEFLYPAPDVAKTIIGIWSRKEKPYWDRVYAASQAEYNPIENYRRSETETIVDDKTEQHSGSDTASSSGADSLAKTGTEENAKTGTETDQKTGTETTAASGSDTVHVESTNKEDNSGNDRVDNNITGFDSNTLVPNTETETYFGRIIDTTSEADQRTTYGRSDTTTHNTTDTLTHNTNETLTHNTTETQTYGKQNVMQHGEKIEHDGTTERNVLAFGNIGVTTSQDMLTQELELAKIIEVIPIIIESFKNRFCLMVY